MLALWYSLVYLRVLYRGGYPALAPLCPRLLFYRIVCFRITIFIACREPRWPVFDWREIDQVRVK